MSDCEWQGRVITDKYEARVSDHIEVLKKMHSTALVESTDRNLTAAERQEAAAQYRALREAIISLRQGYSEKRSVVFLE